MSRLIAKLLLVSMLLPCLLIFVACKKNGGTTPPAGGPNPPPEEKAPALYIPTASTFTGQSAESFDSFVYSAPSVEATVNAFALAEATLWDAATDYQTALDTVAAAEALYAEYISMRSYAQLSYARNNADTYFSAEYKRLYESTPTVAAAIDRLFCAVAASPHAKALAGTKYFASDIVERYRDGGIYTEQTTPLFEEECRLNLSLLTVSEDTVTITLNDKTDTVTRILSEMASIYGTSSAEYQRIELRCQTLYNKAAAEKRADIFISLVRVRRAIADALGYDSYATLAAQRLGYEDGGAHIGDVLADVESFILPIYQMLCAEDYFSANTGKLEKIKFPETMLNTVTHFYESIGGKIFEGYNYALHRSLFSLNESEKSTVKNSFSLHFADKKQSFIYISADNSVADYLGIAGALGESLYHYCGASSGSAFLSDQRTPEMRSAYAYALRLLTLSGMKDALSKTESSLEISSYQVLLKSEMYSLFHTLLTQSMRTEIEREIYALDSASISKDRINEIIARAATRFGCFELQDGNVTSLTMVTDGLLSPEMFSAPMQCYGDLHSVYAALSLFAMEARADGTGFAAYERLLATANGGEYAQALHAMGIAAPDTAGGLPTLMASIYEILTGQSYVISPPTLTSFKAA